ncbi:MAG: hypothetical protein ABI355_15775 [Solirubrobacteraceae bacterium]
MMVNECGSDYPLVAGVSSDQPAVARATHVRRAGRVHGCRRDDVPAAGALRRRALRARARYDAVVQAGRPIMVYNNPGASHSDLRPETIVAIAHAVGRSRTRWGDYPRQGVLGRRAPDRQAADALRGRAGRVRRRQGLTVRGVRRRRVGWVLGCANPAPRERVALWELLCEADLASARELYTRLLPLARLDMSPKLVQYYKVGLDEVGAAVGPGRPPRWPCASRMESSCTRRWRALRPADARRAPAPPPAPRVAAEHW